MFLREFWNYDEDGDFKNDLRYSPEDDKHSTKNKFQTRKSRLTLRQINKMRLMIDARSFEKVKDLKLIRKQYSPVEDEAGPTI